MDAALHSRSSTLKQVLYLSFAAATNDYFLNEWASIRSQKFLQLQIPAARNVAFPNVYNSIKRKENQLTVIEDKEKQ